MAKIYDEEGDTTADFEITNQAHSTIERQIKTKGFGPNLENVVGICATCNHYEYAVNDMHMVVVSYCSNYRTSIRKTRIEECSNHTPKGVMSLHDMYQVATLIDVDANEEKTAGFTRSLKTSFSSPEKEKD